MITHSLRKRTQGSAGNVIFLLAIFVGPSHIFAGSETTVIYDVGSNQTVYMEAPASQATIVKSEGTNEYEIVQLSKSEIEMFSASKSFYSSYERTGTDGNTAEQVDYVPYTVTLPDDRIVVKNTTEFPYRAITQIVFRTRGDTWNCTGFMVSKSLVLTAGHCVFSENSWHTDVVVFPGRNKANKPYDSCSAKKLVSVESWVAPDQVDSRLYDFGAIVLDCDVGNKTGWVSMTELGEDNSTKVFGYPCDLVPNGQQWLSNDTVNHEFELKIFYLNDTYGCMSGSPVMNNSNEAFAIHTNGKHGRIPWSENNAGTRLTKQRISLISSWAEIE